MKSFETIGGKKIDLFIDPRTTHIKARFNPGGELPIELTGIWTSEKEAEKTIITYLEKQCKKTNGKNTN